MMNDVKGDISMYRYLMLSMVAVTTLLAGEGRAQTTQAKQPAMVAPPVKLTDAERKFDEIVRGFEKRLTDSGAFVADVVSQWQATGSGKDVKGTNIYHVAVQAGGKLRLEAGSKEAGEAQFICISDGRKITRLLKSANLYSQHDAGTTLDELQHDNMTLQTLNGSGVDFLVRPQFRAQLIAQITGVEDLGLEKLGAADTQHFRLTMVDKRIFDLWFTTGNQPVLTKLVTTTSIPIDDRRTFQLTTSGVFQWKVGIQHPEGTFALALPAGARRVNDLLAALQEGDIEQLVGQPAPTLELTDLQGAKVNLADVLGKKIVVLIFWASWCAPSTDVMPALNEFIATAEKSGVAVLAVNLGENRDTVTKMVAEKGYTGTVLLDSGAKSLEVYRINAIPVTVLIGKDGTVQAYHSGSGQEVRQQIRAQVETLIAGKPLAPSGN
jgi:peroxiredoxin